MPGGRWRQLTAGLVRHGRSAAERAGATRSVGSGFGAGMELASVWATGLEAAVAIASAVYFAEHGVVFYLLGSATPGSAGDGHLVVWIVVAAVASAALVALVAGRLLVAGALSFSIPPQGGIMTALQWVWGLGVIAGLVGSRLDPRIGWATAVASLPFIAYQVSGLTLGNSYYGELYEPWWQTNLPLILSLAAIVLLSVSSILTSRRMQMSGS